MKIKTEYYGLFVKSNGKWSKSPFWGDLWTKKDIVQLELINDLKKRVKKPVKVMRQVWEEV